MSRRARLATLAGWLAALAVAPSARSQARPVPEVGDRVRVTLSSRVAPAPATGTLVSIDPDSLVLTRGADRLTFRRPRVERVEIGVPTSRRPLEAAGYGVLAAAPFVIPGFVIALLAGGEVTDLALVLVGVAVAGSATVGALIGGTTTQDTWIEADWPVVAGDPVDPSGAPDTLPPR